MSDMDRGPFHGIEIQTDPTLPPNVMLAKDMRGIGYGRDGDCEVWMVDYDQWHAMTPEQRQEFDAH